METLQKAFSYGVQISAGEISNGEAQRVYGKPTLGHLSNCPLPKPLCLAVQNVHLDITELFIDRVRSVDMIDQEDFSLLCLAVIHDRAQTLLSRGARQARWKLIAAHNLTKIHNPIQIAAPRGLKEIVLLLLLHGPELTRPRPS